MLRSVSSRILVILSMLLLVGALLPTAGAVIKDERRAYVFDSLTHATAELEGTFTGDEARQLRLFMDKDADGNVTQAEADAGAEEMRVAANDHDTPPFATLDGGDPENRTFTKLSFDGMVSSSNSTAPLIVNRTLDMRFVPNGAMDTHTLVLQVDEPGRLASWRVQAPPGHELTQVRGMRVTSQDAGSVEGFPEARSLTLTFKAASASTPPTPSGNETPTANETADNETPEESSGGGGFDIPAPGLMFLMAGLAAGALSMKRRRV